MVLLTQWVIPRFWTVLENAVRQDITGIFRVAIERGEPFELGSRQIYADRLIVEPNPPGTEADLRFILLNVAYADLDDEGRIDKDVTAARAVVDIYRRPGVTYLKLAMADAVAFNPDAGVLAGAELLDFRTIAVPSVLEDDARNMTRGRLLELRRDPDAYGPVMERRLELAELVRDHVLFDRVDELLRERGAVELVGPGQADSRYVIRAARLSGSRFGADPGGNVEVLVQQGDTTRRRLRAKTAALRRRDVGPLANVAFDLTLRGCEVTDVDFPEAPNLREEVTLEGLEFTNVDNVDLSRRPSDELLALADRYAAEGGSNLTRAAERLRSKIRELQDEITSRLWKRYAMSLTALLLISLGSVLAMLLRESQPLAIYLWAFLPSVADLLMISSGEHMVREGAVLAGMSLMWAGNALLAVITLVAYRLLARH
jgi:hypothetical protein